MSRPRDIVQNLTIVEVTEGKFKGMRGWLRDLRFDHDDDAIATVELAGRNEPITVELRPEDLRPADPQTIGTGEAS